MHVTFWRKSPLSSLSLPYFGLRSKNREGTQPCPSTENWVKDLLSMAPPIRTRPSLPLSQSLPSEASISLFPYPSEGRQNENHNYKKLIKLITWTTTLSNSMKLWAMPCRATQDEQVMVESSDKTWSTGEGMANHLNILYLRTPWTVWKSKKIGYWKMNSLGR